MKAYMTIEEVAHLLRVSVPTVRWLRQEDRFAPAIKIGRRLVWDEAEVCLASRVATNIADDESIVEYHQIWRDAA
jgi:excisionase family DNA binding protein